MTERLKIVIPIHRLDPGGVERVALGLAAQWREAGHEVTVILGRKGVSGGLCSAPALDYWSIPTRWSTASWETVWMVYCLYSFLLGRRADVVFYPGNTYAIVGALVKVLLGRHAPPMVLKISNALHRPDMPPMIARGYALWLRIQARVFDRVIALSEPMRHEARARMGCAPEQLQVIPNPVLNRRRLRRLARISAGSGSIWGTRYLAAGRLVAQKNFPLLLRGFARAARPTDTLTIAGDGPERAGLEDLAQRLEIAPQVRFAGHVASLDDLLAEADCLVLSSAYEGLPAVVVEALAAGLPVLATDCCVSMPGLIDHGRTGLLVAPGCEDAMASGLAEIRGFCGDRDRARAIASTYEVEGAAQRYIDLMRDLLRVRERQRRHDLTLSTLSSRASMDGQR